MYEKTIFGNPKFEFDTIDISTKSMLPRLNTLPANSKVKIV